MSKKLYEENHIQALASAIRQKNGLSSQYKVSQMASAVLAITPNLESLIASSNGSYTPGTGKDGFSSVVVSVPTSINLQSKSVSSNGTVVPDEGYDGLSQVVVSVPQGGGGTFVFDAVHVWTKSTGGNDAALYIQYGYASNSYGEAFEPTEDAVSFLYTSAGGSGSDFFGRVNIKYGNLEWTTTALSSVYENGIEYDIGNRISHWTYHTDVGNGIIIVDQESHSIDARVVSLSTTVNGVFSPSIYHADYFSEVIVNVPQSGGAVVLEGSSIIAESEAHRIRDYCFYSDTNIQAISCDNASTIGHAAFYNCYNLSSIYFPSCISIGVWAFSGCNKLENASFPNCTNVGDSAFYGCSKLSIFNFEKVVSIGVNAFRHNYSLTEINLPECLTIGDYAFEGNYRISTISLPKCTTIGQAAFSYLLSLTEISLPSCTSLGSYAFYSCKSLRTVYAPEVISVGQNAFINCYELEEINIDKCQEITYQVFANCSQLSAVSFPECTLIGMQCFYSGLNLRRMYLPKCSKISAAAFYNCSKLSELILLSNSVVTLASPDVFHNTPISNSAFLGYFGSIYVTASLVDAYKTALTWSIYSDRITAYTE